MIVFNTTFHLDEDIHDECLLYLRNQYIAEATKTGHLRTPFLALIHAQHEQGGVSYSLQFRVADVDTLNQWMEAEGQRVLRDMVARFGEKALGFSTVLEEIEL